MGVVILRAVWGFSRLSREIRLLRSAFQKSSITTPRRTNVTTRCIEGERNTRMEQQQEKMKAAIPSQKAHTLGDRSVD